MLQFVQCFNKIESGSTLAISHIFNMIDILPWSLVLSLFNDLIMFIISLISNLIKERLAFVE